MFRYLFGLFVVIVCAKELKTTATFRHNYEASWSDLDRRPLPEWYSDAKFGIFIHWGVFSVPSFHSEWFWYNWKTLNQTEIVQFMHSNYGERFSYTDFAPDFTAQLLDFKQWMDVIRDSGAKYVVLTSKHHEGFTMWPSKRAFNWNAQDSGPKKNLVAMFRDALKTYLPHVRFGLYYSLYEWFNPIYLNDKSSNFSTNEYVTEKIMPEIKDLVSTYQPEILWSDGDWEAEDRYWRSEELIAWLYNESPVRDTIVTNDRWGRNITCHHGDFFTCQDRFEPGQLISHKWENCMTIDKFSWGYRRNARLDDYYTSRDLIWKMVETVSLNGNILMNIGPDKDGVINPIFHDRLRSIGLWLKVNGEAIFNAKPLPKFQQDFWNKNVRYMQSKNSETIYAIFSYNATDFPCVRNLTPLALLPNAEFKLISGANEQQLVKWSIENNAVCFKIEKTPFEIFVIKVAEK